MSGDSTRRLDQPVFGEPVDVDPDANYGILFGGMASYDQRSMAESFKEAADMLVAQALRSGDRSFAVAPTVLFLYRHALELFLKRVVRPSKKNHDLSTLIDEANGIAVRRAGRPFPKWVTARMREFAEYDPRGTMFRYSDDEFAFQPGEYWIEFDHLRAVMTALTDGLTKLANLPDPS